MRGRYFLPVLGPVEPKYVKKLFSYLRSGMQIFAI
jgi:hypothetical protein